MSQEPDVSTGLGEILGTIRRRSALIATIALPIVIIAGALAFGLPDVYRSAATFTLIERKQGEVADLGALADEFVYTLTDRVKRSEQLEALAGELSPYPRLASDPEAAIDRLRNDIAVNMVTEQLLDPASGRATKVFKGFTVSYRNRSPEMAKRVTERLPALFGEISRASVLERANHNIRFLTNEAEQKRAEIDAQERQLAEFKRRNFDKLPEVTQANLSFRSQVERQIDDTEREIRDLRQNRVFLAQQLQQEQSDPVVGNLRQLEDEYNKKAAIYASDHPDLVALRRQIDSLRRTGPGVSGSSLNAELTRQRTALAEAQQRYSEDHPDVRRLKRSIENLEERINFGEPSSASRSVPTVVSVTLQTQLNALDTQISSLQARSGQLRNQLLSVNMKMGSAPEVERTYQSITRDLDNARQLYERLTNDRMAAELSAASITTGYSDRFRVLEPPRLPLKPSEPARMRILILGLILAIVLSLGSAAVAEMFDPSVRSARDVLNLLRVTPLVAVPVVNNSVQVQRDKRRWAVLAVSILVGAPLIFLLVRQFYA